MARPRKTAHDGRYYYECQRTCDLRFMAEANEGRGEQHRYEGRDKIKPKVPHPLRVRGYDPDRLDRDGYPLPGDIIATDKPLSEKYNLGNGKYGPKFVEIPPEQVDRSVIRSAFYREEWDPQMFDDPPPKADDKTPNERRLKMARYQAAKGSMAVHIAQPLDEEPQPALREAE